MREKYAFGSPNPFDLGLGAFDVTGQVQLYFTQLTDYSTFVNRQTGLTLDLLLGSVEDFMDQIQLNNVDVWNPDVTDPGSSGDNMVTLQFGARYAASDSAGDRLDAQRRSGALIAARSARTPRSSPPHRKITAMQKLLILQSFHRYGRPPANSGPRRSLAAAKSASNSSARKCLGQGATGRGWGMTWPRTGSPRVFTRAVESCRHGVRARRSAVGRSIRWAAGCWCPLRPVAANCFCAVRSRLVRRASAAVPQLEPLVGKNASHSRSRSAMLKPRPRS